MKAVAQAIQDNSTSSDDKKTALLAQKMQGIIICSDDTRQRY